MRQDPVSELYTQGQSGEYPVNSRHTDYEILDPGNWGILWQSPAKAIKKPSAKVPDTTGELLIIVDARADDDWKQRAFVKLYVTCTNNGTEWIIVDQSAIDRTPSGSTIADMLVEAEIMDDGGDGSLRVTIKAGTKKIRYRGTATLEKFPRFGGSCATAIPE